MKNKEAGWCQNVRIINFSNMLRILTHRRHGLQTSGIFRQELLIIRLLSKSTPLSPRDSEHTQLTPCREV
jgi:hypothetical protein